MIRNKVQPVTLLPPNSCLETMALSRSERQEDKCGTWNCNEVWLLTFSTLWIMNFVELHWLQSELLHLCGHWLDEPICYRWLGCLIEINAFAKHGQAASIYFSWGCCYPAKSTDCFTCAFLYFIHYFYDLSLYFQPELGILWDCKHCLILLLKHILIRSSGFCIIISLF